jgi:hypothetical protein
VVYSENE